MTESIARFLDAEGRIRQLPAKYAVRELVLAYLAEKFEWGKDYTEQDVNAIIGAWHTFHDYFLLRRELIESKHLLRTPNGARYWRNPDKKKEEETCQA